MDIAKKIKAWTDANGLAHKGVMHQTVNEFSVIDCECCQFKHVIPLPTVEELETIYSHEYYSQEKPIYIERYIEDKEWWDSVYTERYERLEAYLGGRPGSILDVGSGPGLFLSLGRQRGWHTQGIEPSEKASEYSKKSLGLDVKNIFLNEQSALSLGKFDVVNMGEVLEHLPDPLAMLRIAKSLLNEGGYLLLVVPNDFNPFQLIALNSLDLPPWWVAPPHHLNYFNHSSLQSLVERSGFEVLEKESTFPIDMFLLMGKNYIENDVLGREMHALRKQFELSIYRNGDKSISKKFHTALASIGIGREVVLYAQSV